MKYIMFKQEKNGLVELIPVLFPNKLVHKDVADALQQDVLKGCSIHSAGSIKAFEQFHIMAAFLNLIIGIAGIGGLVQATLSAGVL